MKNNVHPSAPAPTVNTDHLCRHPTCKNWGGWGYDHGRGISDWWCLEHRPGDDPVVPEIEQTWISDGHEG